MSLSVCLHFIRSACCWDYKAFIQHPSALTSFGTCHAYRVHSRRIIWSHLLATMLLCWLLIDWKSVYLSIYSDLTCRWLESGGWGRWRRQHSSTHILYLGLFHQNKITGANLLSLLHSWVKTMWIWPWPNKWLYDLMWGRGTGMWERGNDLSLFHRGIEAWRDPGGRGDRWVQESKETR